MSSRKRPLADNSVRRKPTHYLPCVSCGVRQGKMMNHFHKSRRPLILPVGSPQTHASILASPSTNINILNTQQSIDLGIEIETNDCFDSDTTSSTISPPSSINMTNITKDISMTDINLLGQEIIVPNDSNMYDVTTGKKEYSILRIYEFCESAGCPCYFFDGLLKIIREEVIL